MSLIIYHEKAIYADRALAVSTNDDIRYTEGDKLFVSPCRQVAFVVCGDNPRKEDLGQYFKRLKYIFRSLELLEKRINKDINDKTKEEQEIYLNRNQQLVEYIADFSDQIRKHQDGQIFAISSKLAIKVECNKHMKKDRITSVLIGPSVGYGTGSAFWDLFHSNGMSPADCYAHAWKVEETLSKNFNTISMAEMKPLVVEKS